MTKIQACAGVIVRCAVSTLATRGVSYAQVVAKQAMDSNGAPQYRAGQMTFPNSIGIDTWGNVYVGEVDMGKRIQKFAPVLTGR